MERKGKRRGWTGSGGVAWTVAGEGAIHRWLYHTDLLGMRFSGGLQLLLKSLCSKFLFFERLFQLQSTVADRQQLATGGLDSGLQSLVFASQFRHLLLMSATFAPTTLKESPPGLHPLSLTPNLCQTSSKTQTNKQMEFDTCCCCIWRWKSCFWRSTQNNIFSGTNLITVHHIPILELNILCRTAHHERQWHSNLQSINQATWISREPHKKVDGGS